jgi:uncharacterized protein
MISLGAVAPLDAANGCRGWVECTDENKLLGAGRGGCASHGRSLRAPKHAPALISVMPPVLLRSQTVIATLQSHRQEILRHGVRQLSLFGSVLRDEAQNGSDVDLLVEFASGQKTIDHLLDLHELLVGILGSKVELLTPEGLSPYIGPTILREAKVVIRSC